MTTFDVRPADLQLLAVQLAGLLSDLEQAGELGMFSADAAENVRLESSLERFVTRWTRELHGIHQSLASLSGRLAAAGADYEAAERTLTDRFAA